MEWKGSQKRKEISDLKCGSRGQIQFFCPAFELDPFVTTIKCGSELDLRGPDWSCGLGTGLKLHFQKLFSHREGGASALWLVFA